MFNNKKLSGMLIASIAIVSLISYSLFSSTSNVVTTSVNEASSWAGRIFSEPVNMVVRFVNSVDNLVNTFEEKQSMNFKFVLLI